MKKVVACIILAIVVMSGFSVFADVSANELVRLGLNHSSKDADTIRIESQDSLALFASVQRQLVKIFECDSKTVTFDKASSSRVNILYDQRFDTFADLYKTIGNLRQQNKSSFYYYDQGWYLALGRYNSANQAKNASSSFSGVNKGKVKLQETKSDDVYLLVNNQTQFAYSSVDGYFFVASSHYPEKGVVTYGGKTYRGGIGAKRSSLKDMAVVNYLMMDHYLYGILPKEMSGSWPKEALKAQAVVARNFAMTNYNKHGDAGYDLCTTTDCQVYGGYSVEAPGSNLAVDESSGDLLYYNDQLVVGYYHSNSGGRTASIEHVWTSSVPYLVSVDDPFSVGSPNTDWVVMLSPKEITDKLSAKNYFIGSLRGIEVTEVAADGRVQEIQFIGSKGTASLKKEEMRKVFGYVSFKSIWFEVLTDNVVSVANKTEYSKIPLADGKVMTSRGVKALSESNDIIVLGDGNKTTVEMVPSTYTFVGHGFGHGIGMSQWGAKKMAEQGYSYEEILLHYYTDTHLIK